MLNYKDELVGKLRHAAVKAGVQGVHYLAEGAAAATKAIEQLQEKLARYEEQDEEERSARRTSDAGDTAEDESDTELRAEARATAELILNEARAVEERIKQARPARHPLGVTVEASPESSKSRTQGRKTTTTSTAPKRATAQTGGFKAKRGQKHTHDH
ncbi:hypothetical protein [Cystobacter ferrugineus]|uniref:Uncharacterized protein n=1 Tax=Cystobacter ferrugineus TaxID=83449 RepID=A0A1L9B2G2_9BACT|nr:hypothetical protein [Cystobacter ferrugineus]OJH36420.1 hypothetical protein BON30_32130 [Cystobacter ferrugineus]